MLLYVLEEFSHNSPERMLPFPYPAQCENDQQECWDPEYRRGAVIHNRIHHVQDCDCYQRSDQYFVKVSNHLLKDNEI